MTSRDTTGDTGATAERDTVAHPPSPRRGAPRRDTDAAPHVAPQVAPSRRVTPAPPDGEPAYRSPEDGPRLQAGWAPGSKRAITLTIAEPQTVEITPQQHQQLISALTTMIVSWLEDGGRELLAAERIATEQQE